MTCFDCRSSIIACCAMSSAESRKPELFATRHAYLQSSCATSSKGCTNKGEGNGFDFTRGADGDAFL